MSELADLLPGYEAIFIETSAGKIFARMAGKGAPVLLLHGYPQSSVMWHRLAPMLAGHHQLIIPDLPGYGLSEAPESRAGHAPYDKRSMANAMIELMQSLGHEQFMVVGHDRGGRVAYRMALDHPKRIQKISTLDIVPTWEMWTGINRPRAMKIFHWTFLAQPYPFPEMLIGKQPVEYLEFKMKAWNGKGDSGVFDPRAFDHYREAFKQPARIHASCEDYRAGQTTDFEHDDADHKAGRKIEAPLLALWGESGIPAKGERPLDIWRRWATNVSGKAIPCGHFLPEEAPEETAAELKPFLRA
jgi:haloacetate dehalogenase